MSVTFSVIRASGRNAGTRTIAERSLSLLANPPGSLPDVSDIRQGRSRQCSHSGPDGTVRLETTAGIRRNRFAGDASRARGVTLCEGDQAMVTIFPGRNGPFQLGLLGESQCFPQRSGAGHPGGEVAAFKLGRALGDKVNRSGFGPAKKSPYSLHVWRRWSVEVGNCGTSSPPGHSWL